MPRDLIDTNVRIDYGKLRHLLTVNRQLNGNFDLLRHLIGAGWVDGELRGAFPLEELDQRDNFVSLLHYFGLLSIREVRDGMPRLAIPNQTVRRLMYGYLRDGYRDVGVFATSSTAKKLIQGFLAAYLSATEHFVFHTERELGDGYADICLEPHLQRYAGMRHGYVIELKYLKRFQRGPAGERGAGGAGGTGSRGPGAALRHGPAAGAAVSGCALHRPGGRVPRLGVRPRRGRGRRRLSPPRRRFDRPTRNRLR